MGLARYFSYTLLSLLLINCNADLEAVQNKPNLADDEVLVGDMIVKKSQVIGYGLNDEERIAQEDDYVEAMQDLEHSHADEADFSTAGFSVKEGRTGVKVNLWKNGVIRYKFGKGVTNKMKTEFINQCKELKAYASLNCKEKRNGVDKDWFLITTGVTDTCGWTRLGNNGGEQELFVDTECWFNKRTIKHELMHGFGIPHEQGHYKRDNFIDIKWNNIKEECKPQYYLFDSANTVAATAYDFDSIMHYSSYSCSKNGKPTALKKDGSEFFRNEVVSLLDHRILWKLYGGVEPPHPNK